jgi:T-complex protein 1 subunit beta
MDRGAIADMVELGILESFHLKSQVVISAAEAAEMVLRIDNIIRAPPRPRQRDMRHH